MTKKVKEQILAIRETGRTNMFCINMVQSLALEYHFKELWDFLCEEKNGVKYCEYILTGKEK